MATSAHPIIIQGGMGVAVSGWRLARAVSITGQLGVVSGTALDVVMARRLQLGDSGGHIRRALAKFPFPEMAARLLDRFLIPGGKSPSKPFASLELPPLTPSQRRLELIVAANFVEVFLAKEGHNGRVGINYLEKIQIPTLPSLFGAMLAGVDYVLMGAGIPTAIPGVIDQLCENEPVELAIRIDGSESDERYCSRFDPREFSLSRIPRLRRPSFIPIVASATLANMLKRKSSGRVDGFVVEGPTAGGHNAPPRGGTRFNESGEPIYGERDVVELDAMRSLGLPFWLAGSYGSAEQVASALDSGAAGVQVGTAFAFCEESGLTERIKRQVLQMSRNGEARVFTDPLASPAGFPFKVLRLEDSLSEPTEYQLRDRICDLGFLRQGYRRHDGTVGWRCPAEPIETYKHKGGTQDESIGRKCICNGLMADIGLAQVRRNGVHERPLITCGNDVNNIARFLPAADASSYTARDVVRSLLSSVGDNCSPIC